MAKPKHHPQARTSHEAKPEIPRGGYSASTPIHPKCRVGDDGRSPEARVDLRVTPNLTGQWRDTKDRYHLLINQAGEHIEFILALVESNSTTPWSKNDDDAFRYQNRVFRYGGDRIDAQTNEYALYITQAVLDDKSLPCGSLRAIAHGGSAQIQLELDYSGIAAPDVEGEMKLARLAPVMSSTAKQIGDAPNLLDNYIGYPLGWVLPGVRTDQWFPLTPTQRERLKEWIFEAEVRVDPDSYLMLESGGKMFDLRTLLQRYCAVLGERSKWFDVTKKLHRQHLENIGVAVDALVRVAADMARTAPSSKGGIDHHQLEWWRVATLEALNEERVDVDPIVQRTCLTHLQAMVDQVGSERDSENLRRWLGLQRVGGYKYELKVGIFGLGKDWHAAEKDMGETVDKIGEEVVDGGKEAVEGVIEEGQTRAMKKLRKWRKRFPFAGMAGVFGVSSMGPQPFQALYAFVSVGVGWSLSDKHGSTIPTTDGKAPNTSGMAWRPEHLQGWVTMAFGDAALHFDEHGKGASGGVVSFAGRAGAAKPPGNLSFGLAEWTSEEKKKWVPSNSAAVEGKLHRGYAELISWNGGDVDLVEGPFRQERTYDSALEGTKLHFCINSAKLHPVAMEALEVMAACELPALTHPEIELRLVGAADQPDERGPNMVLSRNRAISVFNYLKNLLGDALHIGDIEGLPPESKDLTSFDADGTIWLPPPELQPTIVAEGEELAGDTEGPGEYDIAFRRVTVSVNGHYMISLGRTPETG